MKVDEFIEVSNELGRTKRACWEHWEMYILPILKTDALGLPHGVQWMENILKYMVANKITATKQC